MAIVHAALINLTSNKVENLIIVDPSVDPTPDGYLLIASPPPLVQIGWTWNGATFVNMTSPGLTSSAQAAGLETL